MFALCLLAGLCKNYLTNFHKIGGKVGQLAMEETVRLWCYSTHVTLRLGYGSKVRVAVDISSFNTDIMHLTNLCIIIIGIDAILNV